jgi:hypothetical protein
MFWSSAALPFEVMYHTSVLITTQKNLAAKYCTKSCNMKNGECYVCPLFLEEFFTAPKIVTECLSMQTAVFAAVLTFSTVVHE